ncbi:MULTISPECIES: phage tail sheath subtilisin-like domain-containing protein [Catenuloplanes]|uniref:Phage tail sheath protein FI n=1 Tax=Catenuloplanes niger TaxID=587534 RepID=A0AAE4CZW0_9ACTN|nr:phage tail sheath subtilisin-like domain-containing protein [Catenuloplanes niger]MDR7327314.1 phage tail sheath protein FI [Catenuloplanes niger]
MTVTSLPGLTLTAVPPPAEPAPLRTDVAVFLGRTTRGPAGEPVRVTGRDDAAGAFGPPDGAAATPYALRGFFENGGRAAWVIRLAGASGTAAADWVLGEVRDGRWLPGGPARGGFRYARYRVVAASPGAWGGRVRVSIRFRASSVAGPPSLTVRVSLPGEPAEVFPDVPPADVERRLAESRLIRLLPAGDPVPAGATEPAGPLTARWELSLTGGTDEPPTPEEYARAIETQAELPEPALVAAPDLAGDLAEPVRTGTVRALLAAAEAAKDRLVLVDVPVRGADAALDWLAGLSTDDVRAAAVYHPWIRVPDAGAPLRTVPPSGHVAGLIARLDAERGAHHTPANAVLLEAVDLAEELPAPQQTRLFTGGVNLLRCAPGQGLGVWGGRTPSAVPGGRYVAHRRLMHVLVRAIRGIAGPLVFDVNGPELRLALVRGVTSVLLDAYRAGALAGDRPEAAFRVRCDEENNPPGGDPGRVVCDVEVLPATPMEFIEIRLVLGQDRGLEVIER